MRRRLIVANWKMNMPFDAIGLIERIAEDVVTRQDLSVIVCPPVTMIARLAGFGLRVGAQDCHSARSGPHTGDISAEMLAAVGASHVIIGHSERRAAHGETDKDVRAKAIAAYRADLTAIICVGETAEIREAGKAEAYVRAQVAKALPASANATNTIIAYEPVWAIGAGSAATTKDIAQMHAAIRSEVADRLAPDAAQRMRILYGGSMNPSNAAPILALGDVDGGLIGGASLNAEDFLTIIGAS